MPIHMADIGSDNYEQEFTLSLMENEGAALGKDPGVAGADRRGDLRGVRGMRRKDPQDPTQRHPVCRCA